MFIRHVVLLALVGCATAQVSKQKNAGAARTVEMDDKQIAETVAILAQSEYMPREARAVLYGLDGSEKRAAAEVLYKHQNKTIDELDMDQLAKELKAKSPSMHRKAMLMSRMARTRYDRLQPETKEYLNTLGNKAVSRREEISDPEDKKRQFVARRDSRVATELIDEFYSMKPAVKADLQRHFAEPMAFLDSPYAGAAKYVLRRVADGN